MLQKNTTMLNNYQDRIDDVLSRFDFEKVHAYMVLTAWKWSVPSEGIPSIDDLRRTATTLLWMVTEPGKSLMGQGGFYAYRFEYGIKLSFEPFRSSSF